MEGATLEKVQGVVLEAIPSPELPDPESLLEELGSMYPVVEEEELGESGMACLQWPQA